MRWRRVSRQSVGAGREAERGLERMGKVCGTAEAGAGGDLGDGKGVGTQQNFRLNDPLAERFASD